MKEYRFKTNPKEKEIVELIKERYTEQNLPTITLDAIIFGWENKQQSWPKDFLSDRELDIVISALQWIMSPVGQGLLAELGFEEKRNENNRHKSS